jgi:type IV pilus assembly protein PilE
MVVVVIVGILAAVALPGYRQYAIRAKRAEAAADLLELASFMERHFTGAGVYDDSGNPGALANPLPFTQSPRGGDKAYDVNVFLAGGESLNANRFTLFADPAGGQTADTDCGELWIRHTGVKCILGGSKCSNDAAASTREAVADCW